MGRNRSDYVQDNYYAPHANPRGYMQNPNVDQTILTERMYQRILTELSINRFKWTGLPDSVDRRFLELTLFRNALSVFYFDREFDRFLALRASSAGGPNHYDNPTHFQVTGNQVLNKRLKAKDVVPIWANTLRAPDLDIVLLFSKKLAEIDRTIEINSKNLRRTKVIIADENQRLSWQNINRQLDEGAEVIFGTSALDITQAQAFDFGTDPQGVINLQIAKSRIWNECMTLLGINNANQDKKERLVSDEVSANNDQVFATRAIALNSRQYACELINKKFRYKDGKPLEVWVDFNETAEPVEPIIGL